MPQQVRILLQAQGSYGLSAINADSKEQLIITSLAPRTTKQTQLFLNDCGGLFDTDAELFTQGKAIAASMSVDNWDEWLGVFHVPTPKAPYEWLTLSRESNLGDAVSALSLTSKREVMVLFYEFPSFVSDCIGWNLSAYNHGKSQVTRMTSEHWQQWLQAYESIGADALGECLT